MNDEQWRIFADQESFISVEILRGFQLIKVEISEEKRFSEMVAKKRCTIWTLCAPLQFHSECQQTTWNIEINTPHLHT